MSYISNHSHDNAFYSGEVDDYRCGRSYSEPLGYTSGDPTGIVCDEPLYSYDEPLYSHSEPITNTQKGYYKGYVYDASEDKCVKTIVLSPEDSFYIVLDTRHDSRECQYQWYIADSLMDENAQEIKGHTYTSIALSKGEILRDKWANKWIYCECRADGQVSRECIVKLTDNFMDMIRENQFSKISFIDREGNIRADVGYKSL